MKQKRWFTLFLSLILVLSINPSIIKAEVAEPTIAAEAAILMDADTKTVLYAKNANEAYYPASITKLMTALLAIENLSPEDTITFSRDAVYSIEPGSSHIGIKEDEILTVDQALHGLLLMSANEVANGLAEAVSGSLDGFSNLMTERAKELGALNTHFMNAHGLHDENHYTTPYDMALIASYLAENEYFLDIMQDMTYEIPPTNITDETRYLYQQHAMLNPSRNPSVYREYVIGGKTGYTDQAKHTLVTMAKQGNTTLVAVIMKSDKATLYTDTAALFDYGFSSYQNLSLHTTNDIIKTLPGYNVKSGQTYQSKNYGLGLVNDASVVVLNTIAPNDIDLVFDLPEYLDSTYQVGDSVGSVSFVLNGQTLLKEDLIIKQVDLLPEPEFSFMEKYQIPWWLIGLWGIAGICILIAIILSIRRKLARKKYSKYDRLFK
ncbi:MAG: D-alanyl-D-alanine carboxypeptidase [Cellulosilyticum sp.]|nr:D-alanyl-D-alanine carboxypeptidase [Cellulosilyticum sp.]